MVDPRDGDETVLEAAKRHDIVWPALHGGAGEDGTIQRLLDQAGTPYIGAGAEASALCFDKNRLKSLLQEHAIVTPASEVVDAAAFERSPLTKAPFVLKPVADGSSVGLLIARSLPYDRERALQLLAQHGQMLLEELIVGTEITVPVLGTEPLPCVEIVPPTGKEFDLENKYNGASTELCPPQHVSAAIQQQAQELAMRIHGLAGVRHLSRTDMIVTPDERLFVLEVNTLPGMTAQSLYPKSAAAAGLAFPQLVARLVGLARS
jgi:D-alanine-D-alanine ligase